MKFPLRSTFIFLFLILSSCTLPTSNTPRAPFVLVTANPSAPPTLTPFQPASSNSIPPEASTLFPTFTALPPTNTPPPTLEFTATTLPSPTSPPPSARTQYTLYALLDYYGHQLAVDETIKYTNQAGVPLDELVMAVEPNHRSGFTLENILLEGGALDYNLSGHRLTVRLPQALAPNAQAAIAMRFRIVIPPKIKDHPYGYDVDQVNLTDWYPFIVPYSSGWVLHDEYFLGEHLVYDSADFEVNLRTTEGAVTIAASGTDQPNGEWTRYLLSGARTFAVSASDQFKVVDATAGGAQIRSYYYPGYENQGLAILNAAVRAIGLFETQFAAFPYASLSIVQADLNDGQEYDSLIFLATKFYNEYNDSARSNLVAIGVHEISHQWWFGLVGSDQALEPWLDEALCVYSENIYYEYIHANYGDWWWNFRVNYFNPSGWVDTSIYDGGTFRVYTNAAYLTGAYFIEDLRVRMGDRDFYNFLKDYAARFSYDLATGDDFFTVARENTSANIDDLIGSYFKGSY